MLQALLLLACTASPPTASGGDSGAASDGPSARLHDEIGSLVTVSWTLEQAASTWVETRLPDEDWQATPPRQLDAGPVEELVLGLPFGTSFEFRVATDAGQGVFYSDSDSFETGALPETLPLGELLVSQPEAFSPELHYLFMSIRSTQDLAFSDWAMIIDRQGRPVWALENPQDKATIHTWLSRDGTQMLVDHNSQWVSLDEGAGSEIVRMRIDGTVLDTIPTPGLRHAYTVLDDGAIIYPQAAKGQEETLVQVDPDGTRTVLWSCMDWIQENDLAGSCGSNTLTWDPASDQLFYSLYTMETVIQVDRATAQTVRYFGHALGAWNFAPAESQFWWQHGVHLTEEGTLLMSAKDAEEGEETVVREYSLEEEQETLVETTTLGMGEGLYGRVMGEAWRLDNGNTLHNLGEGSRVREYEPDGNVVWDIAWDAEFIGRSTPVEDLYALLR